MNVNATNGLQPPGAGGASEPAGPSALGKEDFLRLLVTQLGNQDPMNPANSTQFVAQLAQFASLEQLMGVNQGLDLIGMAQTASTSAQMVGFIGKHIAYRGDQLHVRDGKAGDVVVDLESKADDVKVTVRDAQGRVVRTLDVGGLGEGTQHIAFDGLDDEGNPLPDGSYSVEVAASDDNGDPVSVSLRSEGVVTGVVFDKGYPELVLDDGSKVAIGQVLSVDEPAGGPAQGEEADDGQGE